MASINAHIHHFSVGEYSSAGMARIDQELTRLAAETHENILPHTIGKGMCRPGLEYIVTTPSSAQVRMIPFVREIDDVAVLVLYDSALRVIVDDAYVTRPSVSATVTNGDFSSGTGWTVSVGSGANGTISGGKLTMDADARGSECYAERSVSITETGTVHAFDIVVDRGPVIFRCGSTSGDQDVISETTLGTGYHSLSFTPSVSTVYPRFTTRNSRDCIIDSIQIASAGVMTLTAPWSTAQLRDIRFDQSADIVFFANRNWKPRKIERRSTTSWSVVEYDSTDGPFRVAPGTEVKLTPSSTYGNVTITADKAVFTDNMVGGLIRLYHDRFDTTYTLAGDNVFSDVFTVRGIKATNYNDRTFSYQTTGTWSGTARVQRSLTGPDGDFIDFNYDDSTTTINITSNVNVVHTGENDDNNVISYNRIGFIDGSYTSGVMTLTIQYEGFSGYGVGRITARSSATSVSVEVLEDFNADTGTRSWEIGAWSDQYQWPSAVAFFDGRLWWGGLDDFWGSASDAFYTFDDLEEGDAATIQRTVATGGQVSRVNWILPLQRLIIGTTGAEVSVRSSSFDEPLTPTNITLKDASTAGSASTSPVKIDSRGIFVHRSGKKLMALLYSFDANDYVTDDLTEYNETICGDGIYEMSVQREPENYVWCVRADGQAVVLHYEWDSQRQIKGLSRFVTDGEIESICTVPGVQQDVVYMAVKRTIDGGTVRYIEKLGMHSQAEGNSSHQMGDAGKAFSSTSTSVTAAHLANETGLVGWVTDSDGISYPLTGLSANGSGEISLGGTYESGYVGIGYDCKYKTAKLAYGAQRGTALLQRKRISQLGLLLANTHRDSVAFGPDFTTMRKMDLVKDGQAVGATTVFDVYDETAFAFPGQWDTDSRVCLKVSAPYPATFLGLVIGVETHEK